MPLQSTFQEIIKLNPVSFERFVEVIDPLWIEQALTLTGTVSIRRRRLPADRIVWLVVGLA
ncbi:transposase domain-containing protein, partial [Pseudomonas quasicaspiana]|nr:transposase domain-containing protein [Pseudomonas quasicaspiana]